MTWHSTLLVALGAVPGAWLRLRLVNHFEPMLPRRHWATFGVNVGAAFALGLLVALVQRGGPDGQELLLLIATGFLGSLSTFSTLMVEVLQNLRQGQPGDAALLAAASVLAGVLAVQLGLLLGAG
ncbi:CrcB family protein [Synechococcus sp. CS-602]|uniref:fluoride efflux transporter FluC n=1 Tax=Synechococcaceae TaxID=1890426 RepID=UPI0008FF0A0D|nr:MULTISPECIES: CrcB family protein [Synechococcaceae]MCT4365286.1 CrcB family protein [Candidatus Regnicoccus frigidus MAG-AL1]APD48066.1 chromosome condensation protein CrcB [Synechococcus sp. SynAce01]MCT0203044.1 CrcB family protein [Synechococcus sp. CS-603]MCT0203917.1 CrcB family protein [Synechococcus sp. CS-602]MCT0245543.1 CrcB family protein [Synechococcus sp. CS-601]